MALNSTGSPKSTSELLTATAGGVNGTNVVGECVPPGVVGRVGLVGWVGEVLSLVVVDALGAVVDVDSPLTEVDELVVDSPGTLVVAVGPR